MGEATALKGACTSTGSDDDAMNKDALKRISFLYHFTDRRNLPLIRD